MIDARNQETMPVGKFLGAFSTLSALPEDRRQICFIGRSNSGKSSLLAALMKNPSIVKTSGRPGSTRTINFYDYAGLYLVDLPGYGYASAGHKVKRQLSEMIRKYIDKNSRIAGGMLLLDCVREPEIEELTLAGLFREARIPLFLCLTKSDKLNQKEKAAVEKKMKQYEQNFHLVLLLSAHSRRGLQPVLDFIFSQGGVL